MPDGNRYAILYRIADAKRPETRERRIDTFVKMLSEGRKIHP
ncbi:MAG TPA: YdeI/OmpD-associated family protein [Streptosporangiaceae bacterium]|nr:YdeI/OmpD-associated family protein [Streptosporangiaceae bacterium]